jgi:DNA-binding GntR family transcriptional regulator
LPIPDQVPGPERHLMREEVYSTLRDWIVGNVLSPRERMRDTEFAERLGVSRTPVREALRRLADEGLVETAANRWTRVADIDVGDARRLYPIVWTLEPLAVRMAGERLTPEALDEMASANEGLLRSLEEGDGIAASEADATFHQCLVERSDNEELVKILRDVKTKLRRLEIAYFDGAPVAKRSVSEHERIVRALRRRNYERAAQAVERNWRNSLERLPVRQIWT